MHTMTMLATQSACILNQVAPSKWNGNAVQRLICRLFCRLIEASDSSMLYFPHVDSKTWFQMWILILLWHRCQTRGPRGPEVARRIILMWSAVIKIMFTHRQLSINRCTKQTGWKGNHVNWWCPDVVKMLWSSLATNVFCSQLKAEKEQFGQVAS